HEIMVKIRQEKVNLVAQYLPKQEFENGNENSDLLIIGWGSTYGSITTAVRQLQEEGYNIAQIHIKYLNPLHENLGELIKPFSKILVAELNNGQLIRILRDKFLKDAKGINKIQGQPFGVGEIKEEIIRYISI